MASLKMATATAFVLLVLLCVGTSPVTACPRDGICATACATFVETICAEGTVGCLLSVALCAQTAQAACLNLCVTL
ncbi:unnamed protein product [Miscanthus lutarioriparius]|uniref:Uncharacterized protein n=1 Tax=Miscanthus lutarioriparius TaxID=422564 RepID=A0A811RIQ7_9POAL|nr:unnamed protein product [Miscanthus lutarioriparius]CAD6269868.1 unnamed protein product [Miscanthus lutarioriparius]